jgi:PleD family two-component response regulator
LLDLSAYILRNWDDELAFSQHWQQMQDSGLSDIGKKILRVLVVANQPMSVEEIARTIDEDEYDVEEVLDSWFEFLQLQEIDGEVRYSFYDSRFCQWLAGRW